MKTATIAILAATLSPCAKQVTEAQADAARRACTYKSGALPAQTLASDAPHGSKIPIDHIVIIMQENHSFDSYYSHIPGAQVATNQTNPDSDGTPVARFHQPHLCVADVAHDWDSVHKQYDNGKNDGFVVTNNPDGARAMGYWDEKDLPFYYALAENFAISDHHHCSLLSETAPNRMYALAATSFGFVTGGVLPPQNPPALNIMNRLDEGNVSWDFYTNAGHPSAADFVQTFFQNLDHSKSFDDFLAAAAAGTLPNVSWVESASYDNVGEDEHPSNNIQVGQHFVAEVANALMASPNWPHSALFITYDEHGGFYDSVQPPAACPPDDIQPILDGGVPGGPPTFQAQFNQYGFRVPLLAVSPYAKHHYISHHVTDATSILRFVEARFDLPAMTARDANADPLFDMFDFSKAETAVPDMPDAGIDPNELAYCLATFPP
jgi:phospholipase C